MIILCIFLSGLFVWLLKETNWLRVRLPLYVKKIELSPSEYIAISLFAVYAIATLCAIKSIVIEGKRYDLEQEVISG